MSGIYEFFNQFWMENAREAFNLSEHGLFHLLLNEANRRHWQMPLVLHTSIITTMLKTDPFELVAIKALLETGGAVAKIESLPPTCINSINYCLNNGAYKSTVKNTDMMHQHRVQKATEMLDRHKKDIDVKLHCGVLQVLVIIATNAAMVKSAFSKLPDKPTEQVEAPTENPD